VRPLGLRRLVDLVRCVLARYGRLGGSQFAAAISYRALFSLVPLATFVAMILAQILSSSRVGQQDLVSAITDQFDLSPQGAVKLDSLITSVPSPWSLAGLVTLGLALWGATGVMNSMQKTLAVVFDEGVSRNLVRGKLVSGLLVLGALGVVMAAVVVSMLENVARKLSQTVDEALGWQPFGFGIVLGILVPLSLTFGVIALLYRFLPHHRPGWRPALIGAGAGALGLQAIQIGLAWYLAGPADFGKVYGSASAIFAFLLSVYLSASAFVICAVLAAVVDQALGVPPDAIDPQPNTSLSSLPRAEFGFPGPLRDKLVEAILSGAKTTTTGLYEEYLRDGEPLEEVGSRALVVDSNGRGVAVIETVAIEVQRLDEVGLQFAIDEGEGFETVEAWREAHVRFFSSAEMVASLGDPPVPIDDDTMVVCETFRLVNLVG
jgi:YihY family inner membrane protein